MSNNPPPPDRSNWPLILQLLIAASVTSTAGIAFADEITQNPLQAFSLAILFGIIIFFTGFIKKVWERLEPTFVEQSVTSIESWVEQFSWHYEKNYRQYLIYRHRVFDVKGLTTQGPFSLELNNVFVELSIAPRSLRDANKNPLTQLPLELKKGSHPIWAYINEESIIHQSLVIIGLPGSGKTTLLKHLALKLAAKKKWSHHNIPNKLPILLFLRNHVATIIANPELSLEEALHNQLKKHKWANKPGWFNTRLAQGRCLIMLDGLDEVADREERKLVATWVEHQMVLYPLNRFIVTSRPHGYQTNPLSNVTLLEVQPFIQEQIERFIYNWYLANEVMSQQKKDSGVRMAAQEGAEDLLQRLQNSHTLAELAINPLLLTMIATVHRYRSSLPGRRVELYAEICETFLGKRKQAKGLSSTLTPSQKQHVLRPLAYYMMERKKRELAHSEIISLIENPLLTVTTEIDGRLFLQEIEQGSGLLLEQEQGIYGFAHLTIQEYLAATHIEQQQLASVLSKHVTNGWWHECIRLYVALTDATPILQACLKGQQPSISALTLALECLDEAQRVQPKVREQLEQVLKKGVEDKRAKRRKVVSEALLARRLRQLRRINDSLYVDHEFISHAEYQLFINDMSTTEHYLPDHWRNKHFPPNQGISPVVGLRPSYSVAFCNWLTERETGDWLYRLPQANEFPPLKGSIGYWVFEQGAFACEVAKHKPIISWEKLQEQLYKDRKHVQEIAGKLEKAQAINRVHLLTFQRALKIALDTGYSYSNPSAKEIDRLTLIRQIDLALSKELHLVQNPRHDNSFAHTLSLVHALDLDITFNRAKELVRAFKLVRKVEFDLDFDLRKRTRIYALLVAEILLLHVEKVRSGELKLPIIPIVKYLPEIESFSNLYSDVYVQLVILEERIAGRLPAFEGIRIVRERKRG